MFNIFTFKEKKVGWSFEIPSRPLAFCDYFFFNLAILKVSVVSGRKIKKSSQFACQNLSEKERIFCSFNSVQDCFNLYGRWMSYGCLRNASAGWTKQYRETSRTHRQVVKFSKFVSCDVSQTPQQTKRQKNKQTQKTQKSEMKRRLETRFCLLQTLVQCQHCDPNPLGFPHFSPEQSYFLWTIISVWECFALAMKPSSVCVSCCLSVQVL